MQNETLKVALAQISSVWLNREATLDKVQLYMLQAAEKNAGLVVFGEALVPGYPFWLEHLNGAAFNDPVQKEIFAHYASQAVTIDKGHLNSVCKLAAEKEIAVYLGVIEKPKERGGHTLYCTLVYIDQNGIIRSAHRKLMPTYEERLVWGTGDGHGLKTHDLSPFTVGGLNCWENWMPLTRTALYAQGEDLHISVWPGSQRHTEQLLPVIAREGRSYVMGVSGLFHKKDIPDDFPHASEMRKVTEGYLAKGGSCLVAPDGSWVVEPFTEQEKLVIAEIEHHKVREERQNFDPVGHYSRPDVLRLEVNTDRQKI